MANNMKLLAVGAGVGITTWLVGFLHKAFLGGKSLATITFSTIDVNVSQRISSGMNTDFVSKILGVISGGKIETLPAIVMAVLAGIAVVFIGNFLVQKLKFLPVGKKPIGKLVATLFYGSLAGGLVLGFIGNGTIGLPTFGTALATVIYFVIVGFVYGLVQKFLPQFIPKLE